jgi:FixJ family two-component response regulator
MSHDVGPVLIVDDDASVRRSLSRLLRTSGFEVEVFASAEEFLSSETGTEPGCLLLDVRLPGLDGLELQAKLNADHRDLAIVFLTGYGDIPMSVECIKNGALDFLTKPVDEEKLLSVVREALALQSERRKERGSVQVWRKRFESLSAREAEVMQHVISGQRNKQIADELGISEKTVKVHRGRGMKKLGVGSVAELVRVCAELGVVPKASS